MILRNQPPPDFAKSAPRGVVAQPWASMDRGTYRPGYELTPRSLFVTFRQAEAGAPARQCDAFEDLLENDGHARGQYLSRMKAVTDRDVIVSAGGPDGPSGEAAEVLGKALERSNLHDCIWHVMDALFSGYSATEIKWEYDSEADAVVPTWFVDTPHRRFRFDENNRPYLLLEENTWPGVPLQRGKWIWAQQPHRIAQRAGLMRTAAWWMVFKRMSLRDWVVFAEKFGIPVVIGQYEERASDESRAVLHEALRAVGRDGQIVISEACTIAMESVLRSGDVGNLHPKMIEMFNAEISKVFTGSTLTTESGGNGSFALGKVHQTRADALSFADARWVQRIVRHQLFEAFLAFNPRFRKATAPLLYIHVQPEMDPLTDVQVSEKLQAMGLELSKEDMYRRFGYRRPVGDEDILKAPEPPAPEFPGGGEGPPGAGDKKRTIKKPALPKPASAKPKAA